MYVSRVRIEYCDWYIENIETASPLRFQFVRAKSIFTLSKNIVYHGQQRTLYFSQFKTPKQVKADFGQNQMAHETHSLKQFFLKKNSS